MKIQNRKGLTVESIFRKSLMESGIKIYQGLVDCGDQHHFPECLRRRRQTAFRGHSGNQIQLDETTSFFFFQQQSEKEEKQKQRPNRSHHNGDKNKSWLITNEIDVGITSTKKLSGLRN